MRILALPAAALLACCVYPVFPKAAAWPDTALAFVHAQVMRLFTRKSGKTDDAPALLMFLLLLAGSVALISALHPIAAALLAAPLFTGLSVLPQCGAAKAELDSGKYVNDIPAYEARVREVCASLAPAFLHGVIAPMLLCAVGLALHLGAAPGYLLLALRRQRSGHPLAERIAGYIGRMTDAVFCALLVLSSGAAGRNPFRTQGKSAKARMMNILGIAGSKSDTHAPMAGDISQAAFLCCFASGVLLLLLTLLGLAL